MTKVILQGDKSDGKIKFSCSTFIDGPDGRMISQRYEVPLLYGKRKNLDFFFITFFMPFSYFITATKQLFQVLNSVII